MPAMEAIREPIKKELINTFLALIPKTILSEASAATDRIFFPVSEYFNKICRSINNKILITMVLIWLLSGIIIFGWLLMTYGVLYSFIFALLFYGVPTFIQMKMKKIFHSPAKRCIIPDHWMQ